MTRGLARLVTLGLIGALAGCAGMNSREQRMLSGGAMGAGAGAAGGYLLDESQKNKK